jgi:hypothetical protein
VFHGQDDFEIYGCWRVRGDGHVTIDAFAGDFALHDVGGTPTVLEKGVGHGKIFTSGVHFIFFVAWNLQLVLLRALESHVRERGYRPAVHLQHFCLDGPTNLTKKIISTGQDRRHTQARQLLRRHQDEYVHSC